MPDVVVMVGMPGVGKTTVGGALARRLGWRFVDTDDVVAAATGRDVAELIATDGIGEFRSAERAAVGALASVDEDVVIAVGGGAVLDADNRAALAALGRVVWLRAGRATLLAHIASDDRERPLLAGDVEAALDRLLEERSELYATLATTVVDIDDRTPDDAANEV
ncbi:MAG TPA: shikimate kinase, partial [Acidimicrobiales bacterium]|nr:shikimate kinase [Acidimicrobiales bacterium]